MTLVAGLSFGGMPAFVGDLLTSWQVPTEVTLPTRPEYAVHSGVAGYYASGLAQKLVIVRPYLMIVWAGSVDAAYSLIEYLDRVLPARREQFVGNEQLLFEKLDVLPDTVEVVALLVDEDSIYPFCVHTRGFEIDSRRIYLLGTGGQDFLNYVLPITSVMPHPDREDGFAARAVMINFVANALMAQFSAMLGLSNSWGGGFEVAYLGKKGFAKVDNILVRCWALDPENELGPIGTSFLMHYEGSALHVTSFGDHERTTVIGSWVQGEVEIPASRTVVPEWTIDLFYRLKDGIPFCCVQNEFPWSKQKSAFHFREGRLVGWEMQKSRVDKLVARISQTNPATDQFTFSTL